MACSRSHSTRSRRLTMKRRIAFGLLPAAVALAAAGCGTSSYSGTSGAAARPAATSATASVATGRTTLGTVLVDGRGRTLYLFEKDKGATSSCYGACASVWPPLTSAKGVAAGGLPAAGSAHEAHGRDDRDHLRRAPALHLRRRREARPGARAGPRPVRCRVVRPRAERPQDRQRLVTARRPSQRVALGARYLGALALLGVGVEHLVSTPTTPTRSSRRSASSSP